MCLTCSCPQIFPCAITFWKAGYYPPPLYMGEADTWRRLSKLARVAQVDNGRAGIQTRLRSLNRSEILHIPMVV